MRYTLRDDKPVRRDDSSGAVWRMQAQASTSFLFAERREDFAWYVSQHAYFRQVGIDPAGIGQRRQQKAAAAEPATATRAANGQDNAEPPTGRMVMDWSLRENAILVRECLALTSKRSFLADTPPNIDGVDLSGGVRLDPGRRNIHGYAWDKNRPNEPLSVICFLNDRAIFLSLANKENYRWEGNQMIRSKNRNGFDIFVEPLDLKEDDQVDAYFVKYRRRLNDCPMIVRDGRLLLASEAGLTETAEQGQQPAASAPGPIERLFSRLRRRTA